MEKIPVGSKPPASSLHYSSRTFGASGSMGALRWKVPAELPGAELMLFKRLGLQRAETNCKVGRKRGCGKRLTSCLTWQGILRAASRTSPAVWGSQDFSAVPHRTCVSDRVVVSGVSLGPQAGTPGHAQRCLSLEVPAIPQTRNRPHFWKQTLSTPALFCFSG